MLIDHRVLFFDTICAIERPTMITAPRAIVRPTWACRRGALIARAAFASHAESILDKFVDSGPQEVYERLRLLKRRV